MKAVRIYEYGDADVLRYEEIERPEPGPGEARVKISAAGVNFIDTYHRGGFYAVNLPATIGMEGAGVVDALANDASNGGSELEVGDRVAYAMSMGSYAEYALVPMRRLVRVPAEVSLETAAALMLQGMTAHYLTHSTYPLSAGDTVLVHAAAGGVGLLLVQIAKLSGARVIGTASTDKKTALAQEYGTDEVINYAETDFEAAVKELTGGKGVSVIYDGVGKTTFEKGLNCLAPRGYMVLYGAASGPAPALDPQSLNTKGSLFVTRPSLGHYTLNREELQMRASDLFRWVVEGKLRVRIDRRFPLLDAPAAHRYLENRQSRGKLLLIPS